MSHPQAPLSTGSSTSQNTADLLNQARAGRRSALDLLFGDKLASLRRWARGRLPPWARSTAETADIVQDALLRVIARVDRLEVSTRGALEGYLRRSIQNRIRDEIRLVARRPVADLDRVDIADPRPSPYDAVVAEEERRRYLMALSQLREGDRELIVGTLELGYTHEQLAVATRADRRVSSGRTASCYATTRR